MTQDVTGELHPLAAGRSRDFDATGSLPAGPLQGEPLSAAGITELLTTFANSSPIGLYLVQDGKFRYVNPQFEKYTGYTQEELRGLPCLKLVIEEDRESVRENAIQMLQGVRSTAYEYRILTRVGEVRTILETVASVSMFGDRAVLGNFIDITERKRHEDELKHAISLQTATLESTADGILVVDNSGRIVSHNKRFAAMWRIPASVLEERDDDKALAFVLNQLKTPDQFLAKVRELYSQPEAESVDVLEFLDGRVFERYSRPQQVDGLTVGRVWSFRDVSERHQAETRLVTLANHDALTGLTGRRHFQELLAEALERAEASGAECALLLLDVDQFKDINDSLGHLMGDQVLVEVARVLGANVPQSGILARLGGDEFAVALRDTSAVQARLVGWDLLRRIREHVFRPDGAEIRLTASIGVALYPKHASGVEDLLSRADLAMYATKEGGRNGVTLFAGGAGPQLRLEQRLHWQTLIRDATDRRTFVLHAQPILDVRREQVSQHELLLRLPDAARLEPAHAFIEVAERLGLIQSIDRWVVQTAIEILAEAQRRGQRLVLEVNLSGRALGDQALLSMIRQQVAGAAFDPHSLVLEVTETAAIENVGQARKFMTTLKALGCRFALDDFGAGYSSFYHLKTLPLDFLKIDGSFVRELSRNRTDQQLVKAIVQVAKALKVKTIAEFVMDKETLSLVGELGVDYAQGFYIGRPKGLGEQFPRVFGADAA